MKRKTSLSAPSIKSPAASVAAPIVDGIRALLISSGMDRERIEKAVAFIEGRAEIVSLDEYEHTLDREPIEEFALVTRPQLAKLLRCGLRTVDYYRGKGLLTPVFMPGSTRARGYTAESVRALLRGRNLAKEVAA